MLLCLSHEHIVGCLAASGWRGVKARIVAHPEFFMRMGWGWARYDANDGKFFSLWGMIYIGRLGYLMYRSVGNPNRESEWDPTIPFEMGS